MGYIGNQMREDQRFRGNISQEVLTNATGTPTPGAALMVAQMSLLASERGGLMLKH
jgi:hypothetical protein